MMADGMEAPPVEEEDDPEEEEAAAWVLVPLPLAVV